jgi:hypothetical protein
MTSADLEREVIAGRLPPPVILGGEERWSRVQLDEALDRITGGISSSVNDWRREQPLYGEAASR